MEWMLLPLKRYADFQGRSRRKEFWMWILGVIIASIIFTILDNLLGLGGRSAVSPTALPPGATGMGYAAYASGGVLTGLFSLAILIPNISVAVRRLHDIDRSGWWILAPALPYIIGFILGIAGAASGQFVVAALGGIVMLVGFLLAITLLVFYCLPGTRGTNRFGPDPLDPVGGNVADVFS